LRQEDYAYEKNFSGPEQPVMTAGCAGFSSRLAAIKTNEAIWLVRWKVKRQRNPSTMCRAEMPRMDFA
jgi:hypothetical protein